MKPGRIDSIVEGICDFSKDFTRFVVIAGVFSGAGWYARGAYDYLKMEQLPKEDNTIIYDANQIESESSSNPN